MVVYEHSQVGKQADPGSKKQKKGEVKMIETTWKFYENMTFVSSKDREPGSWGIEYIKEGDKFVLNLEQGASDFRSQWELHIEDGKKVFHCSEVASPGIYQYTKEMVLMGQPNIDQDGNKK